MTVLNTKLTAFLVQNSVPRKDAETVAAQIDQKCVRRARLSLDEGRIIKLLETQQSKAKGGDDKHGDWIPILTGPGGGVVDEKKTEWMSLGAGAPPIHGSAQERMALQTLVKTVLDGRSKEPNYFTVKITPERVR